MVSPLPLSPSSLGEGLTLPTSTFQSSSASSLWPTKTFIRIRRDASNLSSFPTSWETQNAIATPLAELSQSLLSNSGLQNSLRSSQLQSISKRASAYSSPPRSQSAEPTLATQITIKNQPDICTSASMTWQTKVSVETGSFRIKGGYYGKNNTEWLIAAGGGARLIDVKAQCQGRSCSVDPTDDSRPLFESGIVKQRNDGSWAMKVTPHMHPSLMISGEVVADNGGPNQTFPLSVSSKLDCWLPVAFNCTEKGFKVGLDQWNALRVDNYLAEKLQDGKIQSYYDFKDMIMKEGLGDQDARSQECRIDQESTCDRPTQEQCENLPGASATRARMLIEADVTFTKFMRLIYTTLEESSNEIGDLVESLVTHVWKEAAGNVWKGAKQASAASSIIGLSIGIGVLIQVLLAVVLLPAAPAVIGAEAGAAIVESGLAGGARGAIVAGVSAGRGGGAAAAEGGAVEASGAGSQAANAAAKGGEAAAKGGEAATKGGEAAAKGGGAATNEGEAAAKGGETAAKGGETAAKGGETAAKGGGAAQNEGEVTKEAAEQAGNARKYAKMNVGAGVFVAAAIFGSNTAGTYANLENLKEDPAKTDVQWKASIHYKSQAQQILDQTKKSLVLAMESKDTGPDNIRKMFEGGQWVTDEMTKAIEKGHLKAIIKDWLKREIVGHMSSMMVQDSKGYILFAEYGDEDNIHFVNKGISFTKEDCEKHWVGNPNWRYAATCDIPYTPGGPLGMAVLVRPKVEDKGLWSGQTKQWFDDPMEVHLASQNYTYKVDARNFIASAMHGQAKGGFGYTTRNGDWVTEIEKDGLQSVLARLVKHDPSQGGLYVAPTCTAIKNLIYFPEAEQAMRDWGGNKFFQWTTPEALAGQKDKRDDSYHYTYAKSPCPCQNWWYQAAGGEKRFFKDYVRSEIKDAMEKDCSHRDGVQFARVETPIDPYAKLPNGP